MRDLFSNPFKKKPWMYTKPNGNNLSKRWYSEWQRYFLDFCQANRIHLIPKMDLKQLDPFNRLNDSSFEALLKDLLDLKFVVDWGNDNLRVYWRSNHAWSEKLYSLAKSMNRDIVYGLDTLVDIDPTMLDIPKADIMIIYQVLVDNGKARWVEKEKMILKII
ncbi:MAG: hypothetical protein ACTSRE_15520 [Promethearchaeota archaeon]